jgi:hypothetical protein
MKYENALSKVKPGTEQLKIDGAIKGLFDWFERSNMDENTQTVVLENLAVSSRENGIQGKNMEELVLDAMDQGLLSKYPSVATLPSTPHVIIPSNGRHVVTFQQGPGDKKIYPTDRITAKQPAMTPDEKNALISTMRNEEGTKY